MELQPDTLFNDRYRLIREISRGSFGEVWLAKDERLDLEVAIKVYIALDNRGIEEFKSEYKVAYTLNHPNLLHAHHFDVCENRPFLVMPYCPSSAVAIIGQTDEQTAWRFIRDVAAGLEYLHEQNIVHRDIKPDNILCDAEGHFLITDFGVSMRMRSTLRRNSTRKHDSNAAGTIGYMGPELFSSNPDAVKATDVWALGASLYEMITGELPFMGQGGVMLLHGAEIPVIKGDFSQALKDTLAACIAKETWDRPTAAQLHEYAKAILNGESPAAPWAKTQEKHDVNTPKGSKKASRPTVKQKASETAPSENSADPNATRPVGSLTQNLLQQNNSDRKIYLLLTISIGILVFNQLTNLFSYRYPLLPQWAHVYTHGNGAKILLIPELTVMASFIARAILYFFIFLKSKTLLQKIPAAAVTICIIYALIFEIWWNLSYEILGLDHPSELHIAGMLQYISSYFYTLSICILLWCTSKCIAGKVLAAIYLILLAIGQGTAIDFHFPYYAIIHSITFISMIIIYNIRPKQQQLQNNRQQKTNDTLAQNKL